MKEHPILFSAELVKANLDGTKTMTRRIVNPQPHGHHWSILPNYKQYAVLLRTTKGLVAKFIDSFSAPNTRGTEDNISVRCKYQVGDLLWVRETWMEIEGTVYYKADNKHYEGKWKSPRFMFKKFARIWLEITGIKIEHVQDISWDDSLKEGCRGYRPEQYEPTDDFKRLWESINGKDSWAANPFVWVIEYNVVSKDGISKLNREWGVQWVENKYGKIIHEEVISKTGKL